MHDKTEVMSQHHGQGQVTRQRPGRALQRTPMDSTVVPVRNLALLSSQHISRWLCRPSLNTMAESSSARTVHSCSKSPVNSPSWTKSSGRDSRSRALMGKPQPMSIERCYSETSSFSVSFARSPYKHLLIQPPFPSSWGPASSPTYASHRYNEQNNGAQEISTIEQEYNGCDDLAISG